MWEKIRVRGAAATRGHEAGVLRRRLLLLLTVFGCYALWSLWVFVAAPFDYPPVRFSAQLNEKRLSRIFGPEWRNAVSIVDTASRPGSATGDFRQAYYVLQCDAVTFGALVEREAFRLIPLSEEGGKIPFPSRPADRSNEATYALIEAYGAWLEMTRPFGQVFPSLDLGGSTLGVHSQERGISLLVDETSSPTLVLYLAMDVPVRERDVR